MEGARSITTLMGDLPLDTFRGIKGTTPPTFIQNSSVRGKDGDCNDPSFNQRLEKASGFISVGDGVKFYISPVFAGA